MARCVAIKIRVAPAAASCVAIKIRVAPAAHLLRRDVNFTESDALDRVVHFSGSDLTGAIFGPSDPTVRAVLRSIQFVGSTLTNAILNFDSVILVNFTDADLTGAEFREGHNNSDTIFSNTICPDGTNSDDNGGTCCGHLNVGTRYCQ